MNANTFKEIFIEEEKENFKEYLQTILEKVENNDFSTISTYTEFLHESAVKLNAFESVKKVAFAGMN